MLEELDTDRDAEETDDEGEDIMEVSVHHKTLHTLISQTMSNFPLLAICVCRTWMRTMCPFLS